MIVRFIEFQKAPNVIAQLCLKLNCLREDSWAYTHVYSIAKFLSFGSTNVHIFLSAAVFNMYLSNSVICPHLLIRRQISYYVTALWGFRTWRVEDIMDDTPHAISNANLKRKYVFFLRLCLALKLRLCLQEAQESCYQLPGDSLTDCISSLSDLLHNLVSRRVIISVPWFAYLFIYYILI